MPFSRRTNESPGTGPPAPRTSAGVESSAARTKAPPVIAAHAVARSLTMFFMAIPPLGFRLGLRCSQKVILRRADRVPGDAVAYEESCLAVRPRHRVLTPVVVVRVPPRSLREHARRTAFPNWAV